MASAPVATATPPTPPTPTAAPAAPKDESKPFAFVREAFEGPKNPDGTKKLIDFFPNDEAKCKEVGLPVWNADKYRLPSKHIFTTEAILIEYQASVLEGKAKKLRVQAEEIRKNPEKSTNVRKLTNHYEQFLALSAKMAEEGMDVDVMCQEIKAKMESKNE